MSQITVNQANEYSEGALSETNENGYVADEDVAIGRDEGSDINEGASGRDEYEQLIRTKYKQFYTEDTQRLINRRFKKYKALEERLAQLEAEREQTDKRLADEYMRGRQEAESSIMSELRASALRPEENGLLGRNTVLGRDVSSLTRAERAELARRAIRGESIKIN